MKQAVVLIHGIGEQKPMDTLRSFVSALLARSQQDGTQPAREPYYSKPDPMSELFELRRLTASGRPNTDFYEYYWAYNVTGTKLGSVLRWLAGLVCRRWRDVPRSAKSLWLLSWICIVLAMVALGVGIPGKLTGWIDAYPLWGLTWLGLTSAVGVITSFLTHFLGDAARYLSPKPQNIKLRQTIRWQGVKLLRSLHRKGNYDRIIVVGHSLGSVIGYDLITHLWQEYYDRYPALATEETQEAVCRCMDREVSPQPIVRDVLSKIDRQLYEQRTDILVGAFRDRQKEAWREQREFGNPWKITDFVTLGSPLAHAMLLLSGGADDFEARKRQRELPTCPPQLDDKGYAYSGKTMEFANGRKFTPLVLHHAAPFAVTRWTNLYFPAHVGLFGDIVGGPLSPVFGPGIRDVAVRSRTGFGLISRTPLSHSKYWCTQDAAPDPSDRHDCTPSLARLKEALGLTYLRDYRPRGWPQLGDE